MSFRFFFPSLREVRVRCGADKLGVVVRKAVFSMMAMKRMSILASQLGPLAQSLGDNIAQYKEESEKEIVDEVRLPSILFLSSISSMESH